MFISLPLMVIWRLITSGAGSGPLPGTDAAPYFRIFNPTTRGEKFDREGEFIRQSLCGAAQCTGKAVHDRGSGRETGVTIDYPQPIVNHKGRGCERWRKEDEEGA
ncbi:FAD-binding domain-containing protein [Shigella flexneri]